MSEDPISKIKLNDLNQTHFSDWRDRRHCEVTPATVLRDWNLISHALNIAVNEWKWISANPLKGSTQNPSNLFTEAVGSLRTRLIDFF